jgi:hypothetical protein
MGGGAAPDLASRQAERIAFGRYLQNLDGLLALFGRKDQRGEYFRWSSAVGSEERTDISAHDLQKAILEARLGIDRAYSALRTTGGVDQTMSKLFHTGRCAQMVATAAKSMRKP